ncbi:MAG: hypothetical protein MZV63_07625 [Marinilabiliales bacterium]|nr:hypothetical protein [Marinilabiliales bacterium]
MRRARPDSPQCSSTGEPDSRPGSMVMELLSVRHPGTKGLGHTDGGKGVIAERRIANHSGAIRQQAGSYCPLRQALAWRGLNYTFKVRRMNGDLH